MVTLIQYCYTLLSTATLNQTGEFIIPSQAGRGGGSVSIVSESDCNSYFVFCATFYGHFKLGCYLTAEEAVKKMFSNSRLASVGRVSRFELSI